MSEVLAKRTSNVFPTVSVGVANVGDLPEEKPALVRQNGEYKNPHPIGGSIEDVKAELMDGLKNPVCFITNFPLTKLGLDNGGFAGTQSIKGMEPCYEYNEGFINRSPEDLLKMDYYNIFLNCDDKGAQKWFNRNKNALVDRGFKLLVLYHGRGVDRSEWLDGLKEFGVHFILELGKFKKAKKGAIHFDDLLDALENATENIKSPPITMCCGLVSLFRKKKVDATESLK